MIKNMHKITKDTSINKSTLKQFRFNKREHERMSSLVKYLSSREGGKS